MKMILAIAAGGAFGAVVRHLVMMQIAAWLGHAFPWGTLTVNVVGSFAMGVLVEAAALFWSPGLELRAFLTVGVLGALTTFSTFSLDVAVLYERGAIAAVGGYVLVSVVLSIGALFLGMAAIRAIAA